MTHIFEEQGQNILSLLCSNPLSLGLNIFKGLFMYIIKLSYTQIRLSFLPF